MLVNRSHYKIIKKSISTDRQGQLSLNLETKSTEYRVLVNEAGQILLDPIANIPDREQWLWQNPQALASVQRGIQQAAKGEVHDLVDISPALKGRGFIRP